MNNNKKTLNDLSSPAELRILLKLPSLSVMDLIQ